MDILEYQKQAFEFASYPSCGVNMVYPALGLANEAGEAAGKVKHFWRDSGIHSGLDLSDQQREQLEKELGDVAWYLAALSTEARINLGEVFRKNLAKLRDRKERGVLLGEGDNR